MKQLFISSLESAINHYLALDPESKDRLKKLNGKLITIELLPFHFRFHCHFNEAVISMITEENGEADATIRGTPLQLASLAFSQDNRQRFFAEDVVIEGNAAFGQQVMNLFDELEIDWQEYLSMLVGDVSAHHAGKWLHQVKHWFSQTEKSMAQNMSEFLHEELKCLPPEEALHDFYNDIDVLRMDTDRIEARFNALRSHLTDEKVST